MVYKGFLDEKLEPFQRIWSADLLVVEVDSLSRRF